ncbi:MAG: T9SS type A sorting domain-containing protein [Bacteroidales bacterium]|nr:T9SS type A sorting domain-containing protein [Bacteroidales bacterium]
MKNSRKLVLIICLGLFSSVSLAQTATLRFSAQTTDMDYVELSSVKIENLTKNWSETIYWPDTIYVLSTAGIGDIESSAFSLSQNVPNPFDGNTSVLLTTPEAGNVSIEIFDIAGRQITAFTQNLAAGTHRFLVSLALPQTYFLSAHSEKYAASIKLSNVGNGGENSITFKDDFCQVSLQGSAPKYNSHQIYNIGDNMLYTGYAVISGVEKEVSKNSLLQSGTSSVKFTFEPGAELSNICPGVPTVTDYDGNVYNTVKIGNQCWMRENLKTTHYANGDAIPQENNASMVDPTYDYPENMINNVDAYGLLYNWVAVMHGASSSEANPSNVQGVCPNGWHVPSDAEWQEMEVAVGVPSADVANMGSYRGTVAATLAGGNYGIWEYSTADNVPGNVDAENRNSTGFTALPAGGVEGHDVGFKQSAEFWTSTLSTQYNAIYRCLHYCMSGIRRNNIEKAMNFSVRCVKD